MKYKLSHSSIASNYNRQTPTILLVKKTLKYDACCQLQTVLVYFLTHNHAFDMLIIRKMLNSSCKLYASTLLSIVHTRAESLGHVFKFFDVSLQSSHVSLTD